jgi:hypothetical protein
LAHTTSPGSEAESDGEAETSFVRQDVLLPPLFGSGKAPCLGFVIRLEHALAHYPFARHNDTDLGWQPIKISEDNHDITVKSSRCTEFASDARGSACTACTTACNSSALNAFLEQICRAPERLPYAFLSHDQLVALNSMHKLQICARRSVTPVECAGCMLISHGQLKISKRGQHRSKARLTLHQQIHYMLATSNLSGLRRVMHVAVNKCRMSPQKVYKTLQKAAVGLGL